MFIITVLLAIMGLIGTDIFAPSLPAIAHAFYQTPNHAQLTISLFLGGFALSQLSYGPISDRIGRKLPLIIGVAIFILGSIVCISATSFFWLCMGRIIQGIGVGAGLSMARVILRDCYYGTNLAVKTSQIAIFVSLTPAIAPFVGGILQQRFGFVACFIFLLVYGLLVLILLLTTFKETIKHKDKNLTLSLVLLHYRRLLKNEMFMRYALIAGLAFSSIILYANMIPFITQNQLRLSALENGIVMLIAAMGISLGSFINSRIVQHVLPSLLINIGLSIFAINGLLLIITVYFFGAALCTLIPLIFLIATACGFIFPNSIALCFSEIDCNIGIAGAIYGSLQISMSMITNLILNMVTDQNQAVLGMFYLVIGLTGLILSSYHFWSSWLPSAKIIINPTNER